MTLTFSLSIGPVEHSQKDKKKKNWKEGKYIKKVRIKSLYQSGKENENKCKILKIMVFFLAVSQHKTT